MKPIPFTATYNKPVSCISTNCKISVAYDQDLDKTGVHPTFFECEAIWDTGAMRSTISVNLAQKLGLIPLSQTKVFHADGESLCNCYLINLLLPNKIEVKMLMVNDGKMKDTDMLIGMDIISMCDFALTSPSSQTKFSFQVPSVYDIDFVSIN